MQCYGTEQELCLVWVPEKSLSDSCSTKIDIKRNAARKSRVQDVIEQEEVPMQV